MSASRNILSIVLKSRGRFGAVHGSPALRMPPRKWGIARELMRAHGGDIRLERSTGEGTCFQLILPAGPPGG